MTPAYVDLPVAPDKWYYAGDTFPEAKFKIRDLSLNQPLNLTGYTAKMDWVNSKKIVSRSFTSLADGGLEINALEGEIVILPFVLRLPEGVYSFDMQISNNTETRTLIRGNIQVKDDVTK